jgi:hypothetical protein
MNDQIMMMEELAFDEILEPEDEIRGKLQAKVTMIQTMMKLLVLPLKLFLIRVGVNFD